MSKPDQRTEIQSTNNVKQSGQQYEKDQQHNRAVMEDLFSTMANALREQVASYKVKPLNDEEQAILDKIKKAYTDEREKLKATARTEQRAVDIAIMQKYRALAFKDPYREFINELFDRAIEEIRND